MYPDPLAPLANGPTTRLGLLGHSLASQEVIFEILQPEISFSDQPTYLESFTLTSIENYSKNKKTQAVVSTLRLYPPNFPEI